MSQTQNNQYLASKVLTAPAHRLHLMLVEGAIRFGREAEAAMRRGDLQAADRPLMRVLDIVGELLAGVRETKSELNLKIAEFYLYLFRIVGQAKVNDDVEKVTEALGLLEFERQTWQLVCDKLGNETISSAAAKSSVAHVVPPAPLASILVKPPAAASLGISLEA
jgi:flagellar secretion chaperone FliS